VTELDARARKFEAVVKKLGGRYGTGDRFRQRVAQVLLWSA
jgi:hypothetical protein